MCFLFTNIHTLIWNYDVRASILCHQCKECCTYFMTTYCLHGDKLKKPCKVINDSHVVSVPFDLHESAHLIFLNLVPNFVRDVGCLEFRVHFLEMGRLGPLALVTRIWHSQWCQNTFQASSTFCKFSFLFCPDLGVYYGLWLRCVT